MCGSRSIVGLRIATGALLLALCALAGSAAATPDREQRVREQLSQLPLAFVENRGQLAGSVGWYLQSARFEVFFHQRGHQLRLVDGPRGATTAHTINVELVESTGHPIAGGTRLPGVVSYFKGARADWVTAIPTHAGIQYRQPWPGIELRYDGSGGHLESVYTVAAHADVIAHSSALRGEWGGELVFVSDDRSHYLVFDGAPLAYPGYRQRIAVA